jgi:dipeptidyl aminopeptidase/acylaminoacyl peptidase
LRGPAHGAELGGTAVVPLQNAPMTIQHHTRRRGLFAALLATVALPAMLAAQSPAPASGAFALSIPNIMRGPEVYGRAPSRVRWAARSDVIYFQWNPPGSSWREPLRPYRVRAVAGAVPERMSDAAADSVAPSIADGPLSPDRRTRAVSVRGDLYLVRPGDGHVERLTQTNAAETDPSFSGDGRTLYFVRDDNAFALALDGGRLRQLTDVRTGREPKDSAAPTGQRGALAAEQRALFESVRDRVRLDSIAKAERLAREGERPKPLWLATGERVSSVRVSPRGDALLLVTRVNAEGDRNVEIPQYVTESGYTEELHPRTKVGDVQDGARVAYVKLPSAEARWLALTPGDSARASSAFAPGWNDAGDAALVVSVAANYKTRWIHAVNASSGALTAVDVLRDSAWTGGPCFGCAGWTADGRAWFVSEADGFAHLYSTSAAGGARRQLTGGRWEVLDARLSPDRKQFYLTTNEGSPFEQHFYRMDATGGTRRRITAAVGRHAVEVSPDGRLLADVHSPAANRPPELFVMPNEAGAIEAPLTSSPTAGWLAFGWMDPELVEVPASDGVKVPGHLYRPERAGGTPNGAAVIFVHGAGYLHNVGRFWSEYPREYMFNQYLASKGYVVIDVDYRGSAGYGRDWRTAIYRHMGGRDLQDEVDASRWLQKTYGIDPERIGIYGGSYGGFMTLMALFTEPKQFGAGAALRSVTDWAHYNHPYTSQILNTPQADSIAYHRSSPIYFAAGLEDPLLMAHGMVDVNVNFQDIVRLTERLIELHKTRWTLAPYPVEDHGFVRPASWEDEYRRIFELFESTLPSRVRHAAAR